MKQPTADALNRLAFVRYLYLLAVEQAGQPLPAKASALLAFHDAVELFLALACEHQGVGPKDRTQFEQYFSLLRDSSPPTRLAEEGGMIRLNKARVSLKHYGNLPAAQSVDGFAASVKAFFELNTRQVFCVDFQAVSLLDLVADVDVRNILKDAERLMTEGSGSGSMAKVSVAFPTLLHNFRGRRPPDPGRGVGPYSARAGNLPDSPALGLDYHSPMGKFVAGVKSALISLETEVDVLSLGLDFERYQTFMWMSYSVSQEPDGRFVAHPDPSAPSVDNSRYLFDFVVDSALRLQSRRPSS